MRSVKIAIADDEAEVRDYFALVVERMGHEVVVVAENGQQLIEACRVQRPDLLITDVAMDGIDGIEAVRQLTADQPLPTILVSAHARPEMVLARVETHVIAFLTKPIKFAELEATIVEALSRIR